MSHGGATPPSRVTRTLHGAASMNALRPPVLSCAARPIATTAHPLFSGMIKQPLLMAAGLILFVGGLFAGHFATTAWPGPGNWFGSDKPLQNVVLEKLNSELRLTPAQMAQIAPMITDSCANLRMLSEEGRARRLAILDEIATTIAPELSDDQQRRIESLQAEWQNRPTVKRDQRIVALY